MDPSFWELSSCDFHFCKFFIFGWQVSSYSAQPFWMGSKLSIHSFIRLLFGIWCGASESSEGRGGVCPCTVYNLLGKTNVKQILFQIINYSYDHCSEEVMLWECLTGRPGLDWESQEAFPWVVTFFWDDQDKMNRTAKERSQVQSFRAERNQRYHLSKFNLHILQMRKLRGEGVRDLPLLLKLRSLLATELEKQTQVGYLRWVGMEMHIGKRRDFGLVETR